MPENHIYINHLSHRSILVADCIKNTQMGVFLSKTLDSPPLFE